MKVSRRKFLKSGSIVGFSAAFIGGAAGVAAGQDARKGQPFASSDSAYLPLDPLYHFQQSTFENTLNTKYLLGRGGVSVVDVELVEVADMNRGDSRQAALGNTECFVLMFRGSRRKPLGQDTYAVIHGQLGSFDLLVTPAGSTGGALYYQAVINRSS